MLICCVELLHVPQRFELQSQAASFSWAALRTGPAGHDHHELLRRTVQLGDYQCHLEVDAKDEEDRQETTQRENNLQKERQLVKGKGEDDQRIGGQTDHHRGIQRPTVHSVDVVQKEEKLVVHGEEATQPEGVDCRQTRPSDQSLQLTQSARADAHHQNGKGGRLHDGVDKQTRDDRSNEQRELKLKIGKAV